MKRRSRARATAPASRTWPAGVAVALAVIVCAVCAPGARARAATCGQPDLLDAVPADGAVGIAPNASLLAHYAPTAEYLREDVTFGPDGGDPQTATVTFDSTQGMLTLAPDQPLAPDTAYVVHWPELRGLGTASAGRGADVRFTTGHDLDAEAPAFEGVTGLRWDLERKQSDCTNDIEERFVFDLDLGAADDDGGRDALTLVVFQTAAPGAPDQSVPVLTRAMPPPGAGARVGLAVGGNVGRVCFAALARDLTGKSSSSGSQQACVDTTAPPFFRGCSIAPGATGGDATAAAVALAVAAAVARARRGRHPRERLGRARAVSGGR